MPSFVPAQMCSKALKEEYKKNMEFGNPIYLQWGDVFDHLCKPPSKVPDTTHRNSGRVSQESETQNSKVKTEMFKIQELKVRNSKLEDSRFRNPTYPI